MAEVVLKEIQKSFGAVTVLKDVNLSVQHGEFVVFVGPSGCGKTTLLRLIAGLEDVTGGEVWIDGRQVDDVAPANRGIAMVFQSYALYPHMSVFENMAFGLKLSGEPAASIEKKVHDAANTLQLGALLDRKPRALSGGQRQRVAIGRAIVRNPQVFLFDEPLSNLDAGLRVQMRVELAKLHNDLGATMIYVTHDQIEAMTLADKICVLNHGRIEQYGAPLELYRRPRNIFVASFLGSPGMNFLAATVIDTAPNGVDLGLSGHARVKLATFGAPQPGTRLTLGVRPEDVSLDPAGPISGQIFVIERLGGTTYLYVRLESGESLVIEDEGESSAKLGDSVNISLRVEACHLFGQDGFAMPRPEGTSHLN